MFDARRFKYEALRRPLLNFQDFTFWRKQTYHNFAITLFIDILRQLGIFPENIAAYSVIL